jgi:hypothetical protein
MRYLIFVPPVAIIAHLVKKWDYEFSEKNKNKYKINS